MFTFISSQMNLCQYENKMDDNNIYHWASITKTLTGIGIMQLRDRGLLKLDDLAIDYIPELRKIYDPNGWLQKNNNSNYTQSQFRTKRSNMAMEKSSLASS